MPESKSENFPYVHGFSEKEQERLVKQARFFEPYIYQDIHFAGKKKILEVGCGVGAQSEILMRRYPELTLSSIDLNTTQLSAAKRRLESIKYFEGRYQLSQMNASKLDFDSEVFDGAFLCWVLEHVPEPSRVLGEIRRVLRPGARIYITETLNSSCFLDPYSPHFWKYWMAFNDYQYDQAGDPFVGAKLGNFLNSLGFRDIVTTPKTLHFDNRHPRQRREILEDWKELLLSAADALLNDKYVDQETIDGMVEEFNQVERDPNAVFYYTFMQATAVC